MATQDLMGRALDALGESPAPAVEVIHRLVTGGEVGRALTIAEVADRFAVSPHTLRYYERAGLLRVGRDGSGHRAYDAEAVRRLEFVTRMRLSGMPMSDLRHYVGLVEAGEHTVAERLAMLEAHRDAILRQQEELALSLATTEYKIATYGGHAGDSA